MDESIKHDYFLTLEQVLWEVTLEQVMLEISLESRTSSFGRKHH
jgi:hypothetical protein